MSKEVGAKFQSLELVLNQQKFEHPALKSEVIL
jgi:hypothetical protein